MTEENKNGVGNGVSEQAGSNGSKQENGVKDSANVSNVDEVAKLKEELSKAHSTISKFNEEKKRAEEEAEKARIDSLSNEEKLNELKAKFDAQEEEKQFNDAFTSQGLNASQYRKALDMFKNKDFNGLAGFIAEANKVTAEQASKKSIDDFKSSIQTSTAPKIDNAPDYDPIISGFKRGAKL